jgi:hypothetical protein
MQSFAKPQEAASLRVNGRPEPFGFAQGQLREGSRRYEFLRLRLRTAQERRFASLRMTDGKTL